jgi:hypothetical protein
VGICLKKYNRDNYTPLFIIALFTIAKLWNHPRCPTNDKWMKKMRYIVTMEHYSAIKNHMPFAGKWMELEIIMLSEVSQTQKEKCCMFSVIC